WKVWKRVRTDELPEDLQFDFYNTEVDSVVATDDFFQPFDAVPFKAGTVEAIDNRFVFADCLDELPLAETPNVTSVGVKKVSTSNYWNSDGGFTGLTSADQAEYVARNRHKQMTFKARGMYKLCIQYMDYTGWRSLGNTAFNMLYTIDAEPANSFQFAGIVYSEPPTALEFSLPSN